MAIYITGDIHGNPERLSNKRLKPFGLELNGGDIYLTLKHAGINRVLSDVKVHEMQQYFWWLLDKLKKQ